MGHERSPERRASESDSRLDDGQIVGRVIGGERSLFELLMRRYNQRLFRVARGVLGSDPEAEDALQNGYIKAFRSLAQFRGPHGFGAWMARIVANEALMIMRKRGSNIVPFDESRPAPAADQARGSSRRGPEESYQDFELRRLLEKAIDDLPDAYRATFVLREVEGLSVAETAQALAIEPATVKTRTHRARRLLGKSISAELEGVLPSSFGFAGRRCDRMVRRVFDHLDLLD